MSRRHLLEIHDQPWCPSSVRDGATDCLRLFAHVGRQFHGAVEPLEHALARTGDRYVVDLCSGSGGPWLGLHDRVSVAGLPPIVVLSDLFPNRPAMARARQQHGGLIQHVATPVNAMAVPESLLGLRTLFTAFHHFEPHEAAAILQDAVDARQGIAILEQTQRSVLAILFMFLLAPLALLGVPLIRPFRWSRLFWTYVIPAIPLVLLFDGIVSCLRTYSAAEIQTMIDSLDGARYCWIQGRSRTLLSPLGMTYLIGYPSVGMEDEGLMFNCEVAPRVARTK